MAESSWPRYWLQRLNLRNRVMGGALRILRGLGPVLHWGGSVYVLRWDEVREVLGRPEDFSVALFEYRMSSTMGPFFLGMNPSEPYRREAGALFQALRVPDPKPGASPDADGPEGLGVLPWVQRSAAQLSRRQVSDALKSKGELDLVQDLAHVVPFEFAKNFFGIPEPPGESPELLRWFQWASYYVFAPAAATWSVPAWRAGQQIRSHFAKVVRERRQALRDPALPRQATVLDRLLEPPEGADPLDDDAIARCLAGTFSGTVIPTAWIFIEAVDFLMRRPRQEIAELQSLARAGDTGAVRAWILEACRFFPFPFVILRYAERDTKLAGHRISEGSHMQLVLGSAARDGRHLGSPERFRPGRPESEYMLFGHETHLCHGKQIAEALLTEMTLAVFSRENLRRAPGLRGYVRVRERGDLLESTYPQHFGLVADA